jgi:hypothetical protein
VLAQNQTIGSRSRSLTRGKLIQKQRLLKTGLQFRQAAPNTASSNASTGTPPLAHLHHPAAASPLAPHSAPPPPPPMAAAAAAGQPGEDGELPPPARIKIPTSVGIRVARDENPSDPPRVRRPG